ncbi:MAG TPA: alkaline phosphatase family protein, partial [Saprospiraceae bacterium]|nr:alkaline phosphatase family protein [Saprospiraceae bacterium]
MKPGSRISILIGLILPALFFVSDARAQSIPKGLEKINHIVVLFLENHSFDNLYGQFCGADGLMNARHVTQIDSAGHPFTYLPAVPGNKAFPPDLPNNYFNIDQYVPPDMKIPDLVHRYYQEQAQIDGGRMDRFAAISDSRGLTMGYYNTDQLLLAAEAKNYTLCDHMFHSVFGGSFLNHIWLVAAASPVFKHAPAADKAQLDANGHLIRDGFVTPDGYAVNTCWSVNSPHPTWPIKPEDLVPSQTMPTIGDRMNQKHVSWAWYSGGWNDALAGKPDKSFQFHHQPFTYFANYADNTPGRAAHLKDETEFFKAAQAGTLPSVSFVKPIGIENEHPGYADIVTGEKHVQQLIEAVRNGPNWKDCVIIVTYDENGGFWDHVAPPVIDKKWGPGSRIPGIIISPFAKRGWVDHTQYETVSILALIEKRWGLKPLNFRDRKANYF